MMKNKLDVKVEKIIDYNKDKFPKKIDISVIIVTHNRKLDLKKCLESLMEQSFKDFEIIVVDNGSIDNMGRVVKNFSVKYIKLDKNYGPSVARNVGIENAKGGIVCFLDDDAIADFNLVQGHVDAYKNYDILGLRGKVVPKDKNRIYNYLASHYDLGDEIMPSGMDIEGNISFRKEVLRRVGGFNPDLFGHEGTELTYRLVQQFGNMDKIVYYPKAIIYHDYASNLFGLSKKSFWQGKSNKYLEDNYPDLIKFRNECYGHRQITISTTNRLKYSKFLKLKLRLLRKLMRLFRKFGYYYQSIR